MEVQKRCIKPIPTVLLHSCLQKQWMQRIHTLIFQRDFQTIVPIPPESPELEEISKMIKAHVLWRIFFGELLRHATHSS